MERKAEIEILMFGSLHAYQKERGLPSTFELPLASAGKRAIEIAGDLGLPLKTIGAIYCNHRPENLQKLIRPGDRVAFIPKSVFGPHQGLPGFPVLASDRSFHKVA